MRSVLVALAWLLGIAGFVVLAFAYDSLARRTAQVDGERAAAWIFTPHVGPGQTLHGEVGAYGGLALGIRRVQVDVASRQTTVEGRGRHWGASLTTKSTTRGSDDLEFAVELPADLPEGQPLTVRIDVDYVYARRSMGGFDNSSDRETLTVELPIRSPAARGALRLWSGQRAMIGFALLVLLYVRFGPGLTRDDPSMSESATEGLAYLMLCVAVFIGLAGYPLFAQPLMAGTGWTADGFVVGLMCLWVVGPPLTAWQIHKRRPARVQWTLRFADPGGRTDPASVVRLLEMRRDLVVRRRRRGFVVRRERWRTVAFTLTDRSRFEAGATAEAVDQKLLFEVALDIVEKTGPLTLVTHMVQLAVDRHSTLESLVEDDMKQTRAAMEQMMAMLKEVQASIEQRMKDEGRR